MWLPGWAWGVCFAVMFLLGMWFAIGAIWVAEWWRGRSERRRGPRRKSEVSDGV